MRVAQFRATMVQIVHARQDLPELHIYPHASHAIQTASHATNLGQVCVPHVEAKIFSQELLLRIVYVK